MLNLDNTAIKSATSEERALCLSMDFSISLTNACGKLMRMHTVLLKIPDHIADFDQMSSLEATDVVVLHSTESPPGLLSLQFSTSFHLTLFQGSVRLARTERRCLTDIRISLLAGPAPRLFVSHCPRLLLVSGFWSSVGSSARSDSIWSPFQLYRNSLLISDSS